MRSFLRRKGALHYNPLPVALILLCCLLLVSACSSSLRQDTVKKSPLPTNMSRADRLTAYLATLQQQQAINGAVLVAQGDTIVLQQGFGQANFPQHIPNTIRTRFRIGSNTKQFTAMAVLLLQEQGKLHLTDPICWYLDSCPQAWAPITIQQALTHSAGIPNYTDFADFPRLIGTAVTVPNLIQRFIQQPLLFTPGTQWSYSNSGYVVIGAIIEKVAKMPYRDFIQQAIFTPLGMKDSGYDTNTPPLPLHATGYLTPTQLPVVFDMSEVYAAGALYSTVADLYRWDRALMNGTLVSASAQASMFAIQIPCPTGGCLQSMDKGYGLGWFIAEEQGHRYNYHWGRIDGFVAANGFAPQDGSIVIVLSNLETTDAFGISTQLLRIMVGTP